MPAGSRIRANNVFGTTTDNPLAIGATSFNSASLFLLPAVSGNHAVVVLDPKRVNGEPEIIIVTAHTALATVATITRGAYGTTARAHPQGTVWSHVAVTDDMVPVVTSGTRPADPFEGQMIYESDTHRPAHRDNTQWLPGGPVSIVTSGTRPANPYEGQMIYETDTNLTRVWDATQWVAGEPVRVPNANGPIVGSAANLTSPVFLQMGTNVVSTNGSGDFTITFQQAFPNGLLAVFVQQGDNTHGGASYIPYMGGAALGSQVVRVYTAAGAPWATSGAMRVTWLAIGW